MNNMHRCDTKLFQHMHRRIDFCLFKLLYKKKTGKIMEIFRPLAYQSLENLNKKYN